MGNVTPRGAVRAPVGAELIDRLDAEWRHVASSRRFRERLRQWGAEDPRLVFPDGNALVAEAQRRDVADWHDRDKVLAALLERIDRDQVARRVALQVVLPGVRSLIGGVRGWDAEERVSRVVTEAIEVLARCARVEAGTSPNFRVYANVRRRVLRAAARDRSEPVTPVGDVASVIDPIAPHADIRGEAGELRDLVEWVATTGGVGDRTAREVVLTRTGRVDVVELADALGVNPATLRERRRRAEQRLQRSLAIGR